MKTWQKTLIAVSTTVVAPMAQAHDNGLSSGFIAGLGHPLVGIDHLIALALAGLMLGRVGARTRYRLLFGFVLALGLGAVAGLTLAAQAWVEGLILLSVPVFFGLLWGSGKVGVTLTAPIMGMFLVAHGWAHGVAMGGMNTAFLVGFLLTSSLVMGIGSLLGATWHEREMSKRHA